jgi:hypothetical protein
LKQGEWAAQMTVDFPPPRLADQIVVSNDASMGMEFAAWLQPDEKAFVGGGD